MDEVFGLLVTWTCYGTWLPGDRRGHVSDTFLPDGTRRPKRNTPGTPYAADDPYTRHRAQNRQKGTTVFLNRPQAEIAARGLIEAARQRGWRILRGAVMHNHIHVVVVDCPEDGPLVRRGLKGPTQATLSEHAGKPQRWWTRGGSERYLRRADAIAGAIRYVAQQKGILAEILDMAVIEPQ